MVDLWSFPWWILALFSLTVIFTLLFGLFLASYMVFRKNLFHDPRTNLASAHMESTPLGYTTPERVSPHSSSKVGRSSRLSPWMTRIFIAIVLYCVTIYLISAYPGMESPFWLGIILQGFIYGSAIVYYASGGNEPYNI